MESRKGDTRKVESLKEICFDVISRNLPRYNEAFCRTEDADLKGNLEFLRRFYTPFLIKKSLNGYRSLNESYFNFLINEYLEELVISIFDDKDWDAVLRRTAEVGHAFNIVEIDILNDSGHLLQFENCINFVNEVVRNIPNVERLEFNLCCNDTTMEIIATSCPKLKELTLYENDVTNDGLKYLCRGTRSDTEEKGPSLRAISLRSTKNYDVGVEFLLRNMPSLEKVEYFPLPDVLYRMHRDDKNISQRKYNLLSLEMNYISSEDAIDVLAVITEICPRIRRLHLEDATEACLDLVTRFLELQDLRIAEDNLDGVDCSSFLKCRGGGLRKLRMHGLQISADTLVQSCPKIEVLHFYETSFRPLAQRCILTPLYRLRELYLCNLDFEATLTRQSVRAVLKSSANLRELNLLNCKFGNPVRTVEDLIGSCERSSLRLLVIWNCGIPEATLRTEFSNRLDFGNTRLVVTNSFCS